MREPRGEHLQKTLAQFYEYGRRYTHLIDVSLASREAEMTPGGLGDGVYDGDAPIGQCQVFRVVLHTERTVSKCLHLIAGRHHRRLSMEKQNMRS